MLKEMAGLGFEYVELSHGIRITLVPGIMRAVEEGVIKVASCHNFCPLPTGINHAAPNLYMPSSKDRREREQWLRNSRRSVEFASQIGAKKLVMHLGSVEFFWSNPGRKLDDYIEARTGQDVTQDPVYQKLLASALAKLRARKADYWENTRAGIAELLPYAASKGIALGFENREAFEELPLDEDYAEFVATVPPESLAGYWHDAGHAQIKQGMGLLNHREHLEKNAPRAIGFHLHDVSADGRDHQPIGSGQIDFEMISRFWRPEHTLVLEFSPRLTPEDILVSKKRVEALIEARFGS
ncbi:MAG: sugar phosphate isomerase/epimerase [Candidatus Didemnitutus sp.]|nr:sugar phosphate isomerase/epimerase [Candidatus Didemnitutus sp.]